MRRSALIPALATFLICGQSAGPAVGQEWVHRSWTIEDGLPQNTVNAIAQTPDGYLWLGTAKGLVRFDGSRFVGFETATTEGLAGDRITVLTVDSRGDLWIGTEQRGVSRFRDSRFTNLNVTDPHGVGQVFAIEEWGDGEIWIATGRGIARVSGDSLEKLPTEVLGSQAAAYSLEVDREGTLWIGTSRGLGRWVSGRFVAVDVPAISGRPIRSIAGADDGSFYLLVDGELGRLDGDHYERVVTDLGVGRSLFFDRHGQLWVALVTWGPHVLQDDLLSAAHLPESLRGAFVRGFFEDDSGMLWVAAGDDGLHALQEPLFKAVRPESGLPGGSVLRIHEDSSGGIWTSTLTAGVFRYADNRLEHYSVDEGLDEPQVGTMAGIPGGRPWLASRGLVWAFDRGRFGLVRGAGILPGLEGGRVVGLTERSAGGIWIASVGGIRHFAEGRFSDPEPAAGLVRGVTTEMKDIDGTLWYSNEIGVVCRYRDSQSRCYDEKEGVPEVAIRDVVANPDGSHWLGTYGGGLCRLLEEEVDCLSDGNGLPDNTVHRIIEDDDGFVWLSSNRGVARVRRSEIEQFFSGQVATIRPDVYTELDGMPSRECNIGGMRATDGTIWFPTMKGLASVDPSRAHSYRPRLPRTLIEEVHVDGRLTPEAGIQRLQAGSDRIEIRYTGIHFQNPDAVRFRIRLAGHDLDWVDAGPERTATYTNLEPGGYAFTVQSSIGSSGWGQPAEMHLSIAPFYYQTVWFRTTLGLCLIGFLFVAYRMRVGRLLERARLAKSEAETRRLADLDAAKSRFFANISHEFRTPLTLIISPLVEAMERGTLSDAERDRTEVILENARRLLTLIDRLLDLSRLDAGKLQLDPADGELVSFTQNLVQLFQPLAERRHVELNYRSDLGSRPSRFDPERLQSILGNLVSNALKFTPEGGKVWVTLAENGEAEVEFVVKDTGPGIPRGQLDSIFERYQRGGDDRDSGSLGTGIGLALAKELVDLHGGVMLVESEEGFGTAFIARLPLVRLSSSASLEVVDPAPLPVTLPPGNGETGAAQASDLPLVLVVEDNEDVRRLICRQLSGWFQTVEAGHGMEGLAKARAHKPDLVLTDVMMPGLDGFELCRRLKGDERFADLPVVMLTAKVGDEHAVEAIDAGADDYIPKPYHAETLRRKLTHLIEVRAELRSEYSRQLVVPSTGAVIESSDEQFVRRVLESVEAGLGDASFSVELLASEIGLSRRQLTRRLKAVMGEPPSDLIHRMRMERAAELLRSRSGTVSEIAYQVGFRSASHFGAAFKEAYGHTPGEHVEHGT